MSVAGWYVVFGVGAGCIFVVVVFVTAVMQLARRIGVQLADVTDALTVIHSDTAVIPAVAGINDDCRAMNEVLAGVRSGIDRRPGGVAK